MTISNWWHLLIQQIRETDLLQWIAVTTGVLEVLLAKANKVLLYPAGIVSTLISMYLLNQAGLFAEVGLNAYYVVMSVYGWWFWIKKKDAPIVPVTWSTRSEWKIVLLIIATAWMLLSILLKQFTSSNVPVWDAWISATAWAGMWLLAKRKIENWIILNISNLFAIPLLFYKQLPLFGLLTIFLFIVAIFGFYDWKKIIQQNKSADATSLSDH